MTTPTETMLLTTVEGRHEAHNIAGRLIEAGVPFSMQPMGNEQYEFRCALIHREVVQPRNEYGFATHIAAVNIDDDQNVDASLAQMIRIVFCPTGVWIIRPHPDTGNETNTGVHVENYIYNSTHVVRCLAFQEGEDDDPVVTNLYKVASCNKEQ
jgi:hypothetical protein